MSKSILIRLAALLILVISISCVDKQTDAKKTINHKLSAKVQAAVDSLSKLEQMSEGGKLRFNNLLKVASVEDLVFLTDHKLPIIRCYAFYGLTGKKYKRLKDIFDNHVKDTAHVYSVYGCLGDHATVMELMLREFHPSIKSNKERFSKSEYDKYDKIVQAYKKNIKYKSEPDYEEQVKKLQSYHLEHYQLYYWGASEDKDFEEKRKLVRKNIPFETYENTVLATAYFEVNACNSHFPNIERKGDTIILKDQILKKYPCDKKARKIDKIVFFISDVQVSKIKTVIAE